VAAVAGVLVLVLGSVLAYLAFAPGPAQPAASGKPAERPGKNTDPGRTAAVQAGNQGGPGTPTPAGGLPSEVLRKVKKATVRVRVALADKSTATGSGFFGAEPGVLLTNAHVVGMLGREEPPPEKVEVILNSGEPDELTLTARVASVDRVADLAVLRLEEGRSRTDRLPQPLQIASALGLQETQPVYVAGFPLGLQLGKNVTISQTSVSSLRKDAGGALQEIQLNGGMHPGNSGGPVVDGRGNVVGVAVAVILNTQINFAIPGDVVNASLHGRVAGITCGDAARKGDLIALPVTVELIDPLGRARKVSLDWWTGPVGAVRTGPPGTAAPQPGDSERKTLVLDRRFEVARGELRLPAAPAGKVYWFQANLVDAAGQNSWGTANMYQPQPPHEPRPIALARKRLTGTTAPLELRGDFSLLLHRGEDEVPYEAHLAARLAETLGAVAEDGTVTLRLKPAGKAVGEADPLKWGEQGEELFPPRDDLRALNRHLAGVPLEAKVDRDGDLTWERPDLSELGSKDRDLAKDFLGPLQKLLTVLTVPLPREEMKPGYAWSVSHPLPLGLAKFPLGTSPLDMTYTYRGVQLHSGREQAYLTVEGILREEPLRRRQVTGKVEGTAGVDLQTGEVGSIAVTVTLNVQLLYEEGPVYGHGVIQLRLYRGAAGEEAAPNGMEELRGRWRVVRWEKNGKPWPAEPGDAVWVFKQDSVDVVSTEGDFAWNVKLDTARNPKAIDLTGRTGDRPLSRPGIYLRAGDHLVLCYQAGRAGRPSQFFTRPDSGLELVFLRRLPDEKP
jgi:uncharacterized protein (TIGR03067 family)